MICIEFKKSASISDSAAKDITFFNIFAIFNTDSLSVGSYVLFDNKKYPPPLLSTFGLHRYNTLLCTFRIMSLALYVNIPSGQVVT